MVQTHLNFLSQSEINLVKDEVYNLKQYWKHSSQYRNSGLLPYKDTPIIEVLKDQYKAEYLLGDPLYRLEGYKEDINLETQFTLLEKFYWLYTKTIDKITEITSIESELEPNLTIPGFHVYASQIQPFNEFKYHTDVSIVDYYPNLDVNKIYSFVALIESKGTTPYLEYETGPIKTSSFSTHGSGQSNSITISTNSGVSATEKYQLGALHIWEAKLSHRIGGFELKEGDSRITFQGHYYYDPKSKTNKLYF
jgi:hypothetical protein